MARDVPKAQELPDPTTVYKVAFSVAQEAPEPGGVNPMLEPVARYVNTLAKYGVPAENRQIAVVLHRGGTDIVMNNDAFKSRYEGRDNPDIALIRALKQAGVDFRVCGQALMGRRIDPADVQPEIQVDLWAADDHHEPADARLRLHRGVAPRRKSTPVVERIRRAARESSRSSSGHPEGRGRCPLQSPAINLGRGEIGETSGSGPLVVHRAGRIIGTMVGELPT